MKVLYGVSPIGLGHATRSLVLRSELVRQGAEVRMFSGGKAAEFLGASGVKTDDVVSDPVPSVAGGEMKWAALWYIRSWLALKRTKPRTRQIMDAFTPDIVLCDEEFSGMVLAEEAGIKRAFIADELELGFARGTIARRIEKRVEGWYDRLQASADLLLIPDHGKDVGNKRFVGPLVRQSTMPPSDVRARYGLPSGPMVLFSTSGSGIGRDLMNRAVSAFVESAPPGAFLVISGNRGAKVRQDRVHDLGVVLDNQDLVAAADLVISTAGKSTIDEAEAAGTPMIAIPIRNHAEQERNARALGFTADDTDRLPELMGRMLGQRRPPRPSAGAAVAASHVLSLFRQSG